MTDVTHMAVLAETDTCARERDTGLSDPQVSGRSLVRGRGVADQWGPPVGAMPLLCWAETSAGNLGRDVWASTSTTRNY
jgi:hypothetical protein